MLGEDVELLLPCVEALVITSSGAGGYEFRTTFPDASVLPLTRALLRAQADVLTESEVPQVTGAISSSALMHTLLAVLSAPLAGRAKERQLAALFGQREALKSSTAAGQPGRPIDPARPPDPGAGGTR